jgi:hypothetical protein
MGRYLDLLRDPGDSGKNAQSPHYDKNDRNDQSHSKVAGGAVTRAVGGVRSFLSVMSYSRSSDSRPTAPESAEPGEAEKAPDPEDGRAPIPAPDIDRLPASVVAPVQWFAPEDDPADEPHYREPCAARRGLIRRHRNGRLERFCAVCGAWGAFGYDATAARPGRWFCFEHRPEG